MAAGSIEKLHGFLTYDKAGLCWRPLATAGAGPPRARLGNVLKLAPNDASAHCALGVLRVYANRVAQGVAESRAVRRGGNCAAANEASEVGRLENRTVARYLILR
jgi:hypothetical protein